MFKGREYHGLPVLLMDNASCVGQIKDLILTESGHIESLIVEVQGQEKLLSIENIVRFNESELVIKDVLCLSSQVPVTAQLRRGSLIKGRVVRTCNGHVLGEVGDLIVDQETNSLTGIEVSDGLLQDLLTGRLLLPRPDVINWGPETVVVADHWENAWQKKPAE